MLQAFRRGCPLSGSHPGQRAAHRGGGGVGRPVPPIVNFQMDGDSDTYFAIRRADGQFWACNRLRGFRLCGLNSKRFRPQLVAGDHQIPVRIIASADVSTAV